MMKLMQQCCCNTGSTESDMTRVTGSGPGRLPNTNMHSTEGSNPIWMQAYENEWYKEDDSMRYSHFH